MKRETRDNFQLEVFKYSMYKTIYFLKALVTSFKNIQGFVGKNLFIKSYLKRKFLGYLWKPNRKFFYKIFFAKIFKYEYIQVNVGFINIYGKKFNICNLCFISKLNNFFIFYLSNN